jgi:SAM-dependent methyltransferase
MNLAAWQEHARQRQLSETPGPASPPARMHWTPHQGGHGPGAEILGDLNASTVVELGCGAGHHLAHLVATHGVTGAGVDIASGQIERARARYGHLPRIRFTTADAILFLSGTEPVVDVCYSVFGAVGLTPPGLLLPMIAATLRPGGLLAFSVPHPSRRGRTFGATTLDTLALPLGGQLPIQRWEPAVSTWLALLAQLNFDLQDLHHLASPDPSEGPTTLLVTARRR